MARTRAQGAAEETGDTQKPALANANTPARKKSSATQPKPAARKRKTSEKEDNAPKPESKSEAEKPAAKSTTRQTKASLSSKRKSVNDEEKVEPEPEKDVEKPAAKQASSKQAKPSSTKRKVSDKKDQDEQSPEAAKESEKPAPAAKKARSSGRSQTKKHDAPAESSNENSSSSNPKIAKLIGAYGQLPLSDMALSSPDSPTPETILAHVLHAMLTSARISHQIALHSVKCLIDAGYHDVNVLKKSSWEERTEVLTKGGYTHYREKTATMLRELADLVLNEYNGDLNNLLKASNEDATTIRNHIKAIKGFGNVGVDILCDTAQALWPCLAPFVDDRSLKLAGQLGLDTDVQKLYDSVGKDPKQMCRLSAALTAVRLDKKEKEFMD